MKTKYHFTFLCGGVVLETLLGTDMSFCLQADLANFLSTLENRSACP